MSNVAIHGSNRSFLVKRGFSSSLIKRNRPLNIKKPSFSYPRQSPKRAPKGLPHENESFLAKKWSNAKFFLSPIRSRKAAPLKNVHFSTLPKMLPFHITEQPAKKLRVTAKFCQKVRLFLQKRFRGGKYPGFKNSIVLYSTRLASLEAAAFGWECLVGVNSVSRFQRYDSIVFYKVCFIGSRSFRLGGSE